MPEILNHQTVSELSAFDAQPRTRLVFGNGAVKRTGKMALEIGAKHVLLVTDQGIAAAGHASRVERLLRGEGLEVTLYDQARENPTTRDVDACLSIARPARIDAIIGLGGGSSLDTAKGTNFLLSNGGQMKDYRGVGRATGPMLPFIAIPTTAGTGSECQCAALIADEETHQKMACLDPKAAARVAILDPELTMSQPRVVTAHTGVDAIAHAMETAVTTKRNPFSLMYSLEAFRMLAPNLPVVLNDPNDLEARGRMQLGAAFAGTAIENSMLGAAHAAANPLTAHYGIVHGEAVGVMLPHVIRYNAVEEATRRAYAELASAPEIACVSDGLEDAVDALVARLEALLNLAGIARSLEALGVAPSLLPTLAEEAAAQWTAGFNPRPVDKARFERLYQSAFEARGEGDAG